MIVIVLCNHAGKSPFLFSFPLVGCDTNLQIPALGGFPATDKGLDWIALKIPSNSMIL